MIECLGLPRGRGDGAGVAAVVADSGTLAPSSYPPDGLGGLGSNVLIASTSSRSSCDNRAGTPLSSATASRHISRRRPGAGDWWVGGRSGSFPDVAAAGERARAADGPGRHDPAGLDGVAERPAVGNIHRAQLRVPGCAGRPGVPLPIISRCIWGCRRRCWRRPPTTRLD